MDTLDTLFGNHAKVRLLRYFLLNQTIPIALEELSKKTGVSRLAMRKELPGLLRAHFLKRKLFFREVEMKRGKKKTLKKKKFSGFLFDERFQYKNELQNLLVESLPLDSTSLIRRFSSAGKVKLIVISGAFVQNLESRIDLLLVGDRLNKNIIDRKVKSLEVELGRELRYAVFETSDFKYRVNVYDKLLRDVFDYPHRKILDRVGMFEGIE